jgi:hypothetical protein
VRNYVQRRMATVSQIIAPNECIVQECASDKGSVAGADAELSSSRSIDQGYERQAGYAENIYSYKAIQDVESALGVSHHERDRRSTLRSQVIRSLSWVS